MNNDLGKIRVGVGIMIFKDGKVLMGRRKGSHGAGEYAFPGGHLDFGESFEDCAKRETLEEAGIHIKNVKFLAVENVTAYEPHHYVNIELTADWESGEPKVMEPNKRENWEWCDIDNIPPPVFSFCSNAIDAYKTGKNYYDKK